MFDHQIRSAAELVEQKGGGTMVFLCLPIHGLTIDQNQKATGIIREIGKRTQVVGAFTDGHSALMLAAARLQHIALSNGESGVA